MNILRSVQEKARAIFRLHEINRQEFKPNPAPALPPQPRSTLENLSSVNEALNILLDLAVTEYVEGITGEYRPDTEFTHRARIEAIKWCLQELNVDRDKLLAWEKLINEHRSL